MKVLFVCTANRLRSPTAVDVFSGLPGVDVTSAGISLSAPNRLTAELVTRSDLIFVMEARHREWIRQKFRDRPADSRILILHIPDEYDRGDPVLIDLLKERAGPIMEKARLQAEQDERRDGLVPTA